MEDRQRGSEPGRHSIYHGGTRISTHFPGHRFRRCKWSLVYRSSGSSSISLAGHLAYSIPHKCPDLIRLSRWRIRKYWIAKHLGVLGRLLPTELLVADKTGTHALIHNEDLARPVCAICSRTGSKKGHDDSPSIPEPRIIDPATW